ncbi:GNAT family N-acetyltransferase [Pseudoroseicyclus tamaricis]|uniref:GNAT family N-acetyltransferase n=1 Tax=Pseudoroseicyclus tamaricis TaxID=2705421 RepID=UPI001F1F856F|nr:GNAT family N-acetyltransferase [Pseudoroseicyclus tamaricis]
MSDEVTYEEAGGKGRYHIDWPEGSAELVTSLTSPELVIAEHTEVPKALEGQGLAKQLVEALVQDARERHFRIVALCPYVKAQRAKHPEWTGLFTD